MVSAVLVSHCSLTYTLYVTQGPPLLLPSTASQHRLQNSLSVRTTTFNTVIWLLEISPLT